VDRQTAGRTAQQASRREDDPAREIRARAWRYVFDCYEKKKVGEKAEGERHDLHRDNARARHE